MSFAALCGSQVWNSVTLLPLNTPASASATAVELCGWALASSSGGLKSVSVSLLELCPVAEPRSLASTRSERGGARRESDCSDLGAFDAFGSGELPCCAHAATANPKIAKDRKSTRLNSSH